MTNNEYRELNRSSNGKAFFMINKKLLFLLGEKTTRYLAELIYKEGSFFDDGVLINDEYFYYQMDRMQADTLLTGTQQATCIKILSTLQIIEVKKIGLPAKYHFKINHENITKVMASELQDNIENFSSLCKNFIKKESLKDKKECGQTTGSDEYQSQNKITIIKQLLSRIESLVPNKTKGLVPNKTKGLDLNETKAQNKNILNNTLIKNNLVTSSKEEVSETDVSLSAPSKLHKRTKGQMLKNAKLPLKPLKEKKPVKPYEPTSKATHLIRYWESKGLHVPAVETQSYRDSLVAFDKLLSGKAFNGTEYDDYENKKIDIKDVKKAIDRFAYMALNPDYEPRDINFKKKLSKITPSNFIYSSFAPSNGYGRSKFINCLENEPKLIREKDVYVEDKYPKTSVAVAKEFKNRVLGGCDIEFTNDDINCFRKAANFATDLFKKNSGRLMGSYANMEPFRIAQCLFEALESGQTDLKKVKPHWLCNSNMKTQLPQYLYQSAIFQDIDCSAKEKTIQYHNFGEPFRG